MSNVTLDDDEDSIESEWEVRDVERRESQKSSDSVVTKEVGVKEKHRIEKIFYLPFYRKWEIMIIFSIWLSFVLSLNEAAFTGRYASSTSSTETRAWQSVIFLFLTDVVYAVDVTFAIIHKLWKELQAQKIYQPRRLSFIVVDIISLIPAFYVYDLIIHSDNTSYFEDRNFMFYTSINRFLRMYRPFVFLTKSLENIHYNIILTEFNYLFYFTLSVALFATYFFHVAWHPFSMSTSSTPAILPELNATVFKSWPMNTESDWYKMSLYVALDIISTRGVLAVEPITYTDYAVYMFVMFFTIVLYWYSLGLNVVYIVNDEENFSLFCSRYKYTVGRDSNKQMSAETVVQVKQRYSDLWVSRRGIHGFAMNDVIPEGVRGDIMLDIYWNALNHSHLFRDLELAFLTEVAKQMTTTCYSPGQLIFAKNEFKSKMIYIFKGMVGVLTAEDDTSPIMNFTSGTCLGETSLVVSCPNNFIVVSCSSSEIQILDKKDLHSLSTRYRESLKHITKQISKRILDARRVNLVCKMCQVGDIRRLIGKRADSSTKWVKNRLLLAYTRAIDEQESRRMGRTNSPEPILGTNAVEVQHTMKYFDMLAMNETAMHVRKNIVFLTTSFPIIINPENPVLLRWKKFFMLNVAVVAIVLPYCASVAREHGLCMKSFFMYIQFIYLLDIWIQTTTAVNVSNRILIQIDTIFYYRLGEVGYLVDMFATLPLGYMPLFIRYGGVNAWALFQYNKLLQLWKLVQYDWKLRESFDRDQFLFRLFTYAVTFFYVEYFSASVLFIVSCFDSECDPKGWWMQLFRNDPKNTAPYENFLFSFRFAQMICTGCRLFTAKPYTMAEHLIVSIIFFVSCYLCLHFLSSLIAHKTRSGMLMSNQANVTKRVTLLLKRHGLTEKSILHRRAMNQLNAYLNYDKGFRATQGLHEVDRLMRSDLYPQLLSDARIQLWGHYFFKVPLFQDMDGDFIYKLTEKVIIAVVPENGVVSYSGETAKALFIIDQGYCEVVTGETGVSEVIYGPGWSFYGLEMVVQIPVIKTVRTVTCCRFLTIRKAHLNETLSNFPEQKIGFEENVRKCRALVDLQVFESTLSDISAMLESNFKIIDKTRNNFYKYSYDMIQGSKEYEDYIKPFRALGRFSLLRILLLRIVFLPRGRAIFIKVGIRCLMATATAIIFPVLPIVRLYFPWAEHTLTFLDITLCVDIYLSLHTAYYNNNGILVSHPLETAKHYLSHSFALDLLGVVPLQRLTLGVVIHSWLKYSRLIQMHRVFGTFSYLDKNIMGHRSLIAVMKYAVVMIILTITWASIYIDNNCKISFDLYPTAVNETSIVEPYNTYSSVGISCSYRNWYPSLFGLDDTPSKHLAYVVLVSSATLTRSCFRGTRNTFHEGGLVTEVVIFLAYLLSVYMAAQIIYTRFRRNLYRLYSYRRTMNYLVRYLQRSKVDERVVQQVKDYFIINWEAYNGLDTESVLSIFHAALKEDILCELYSKTLKEHSIFTGASNSFFRGLLSGCRYFSFPAGSVVFKKFDVHSEVYLINKGLVNVYFTAGKKITTLGPGAIFGNLQGHNKIQHMCSAVAHTQLDVLSLSTDDLFSVLGDHPRIKELFLSRAALKPEFIGSKALHEFTDGTSAVPTSGLCWKMISEPKLYDIQAVIASVCSCILSTYIACFEHYSLELLITMYALDFYRLSLVLLKFYLPFKNAFGHFITEQNLIRKNYLHTNFWVDCFSLMPLELLWWIFPAGYKFRAFEYLRLNRAIAVINYGKYYEKYISKISTHFFSFQFTYIVVSNLVYNHIFACSIRLLFMYEIYKTGGETSETIDYWKCATFVFAVEGHFNFYYRLPKMSQELTMIAIAVFNIVVNARLIYAAGDMIFLLISHYTQTLQYITRLRDLLKYLREMDLSYYLISVVEDYHDYQWSQTPGRPFGSTLDVLPTTLRERIVNELFGHHFVNHYVFQGCNKEFLRQLVRSAIFQQYIPNNLIVRRGIANGTMYFLHSGKVELWGDDPHQKKILQEGTCFGTFQGLSPSSPHNYNFRAHTLVELVELNYQHWQYLVDHFPKDRERILSFSKRR